MKPKEPRQVMPPSGASRALSHFPGAAPRIPHEVRSCGKHTSPVPANLLVGFHAEDPHGYRIFADLPRAWRGGRSRRGCGDWSPGWKRKIPRTGKPARGISCSEMVEARGVEPLNSGLLSSKSTAKQAVYFLTLPLRTEAFFSNWM
jgi:hypothetical protein